MMEGSCSGSGSGSVRLLAISLLLAAVTAPLVTSLTTDGLALLALKFAVSSDPTGALDSWRDSDSDPCGWTGVSCSQTGRVASVSLSNCSLLGYLPSELSLLTSLETLTLAQNRFSGLIPAAVSALRSLTYLDLSHNLLTGPVPLGIAVLTALSHLDLSANFLNGSLPPALAGLSQLSGVLNLSFNEFAGKIPAEFGNIPVVVSLDLRHNNLSGEIPQVGSLVNQGPTAFAGNADLCGFPLKNPCPGSNQEPKLPEPGLGFNSTLGGSSSIVPDRQKRKPAVTIPILVGIVVIAVLSVFVLQWQCRQRCTAANNQEKETKKEKGDVLFAASEDKRDGKQDGELFVALDEGFTLELEELLRASAYVVGKSRGGIVYKVVPMKGPVVAVRRLSEADDAESSSSGSGDKWRRRRSFESEAAAIGQARHPNVVRLQAYYYAPEEKLLIYDFIPNGTLHSALHGGPLNQSSSGLNWAARLSIVQGAAQGLAYLHECSPRKYVHGSIKSTKILLDDELHPYVSGFGLTRLVSTTQKLTHSASKKLGPASGARGAQALAYVAPEGRAPGTAATQKGDIYAFGMVLLEVVTGRVPGASGEGETAVPDLEGWVRRAFKEERPLSEVVDPALLHEVHAKKQVLAVFHVALGCTEPDPEMRPRMRAVSESLDRIGQ